MSFSFNPFSPQNLIGDPFNLSGMFSSNGAGVPAAVNPLTSTAPGATLGTRPGSTDAAKFANLASIIGNDLPWLSQQQNQTILPNAQANFNAQAALTPQQLQLMQQMYQQYMPGLTSAVSDVQRQQQQETAGNNAAVSGGPQGQAALAAAMQAFNATNPGFLQTSGNTANSLGNLMGSIDLTGALSGSQNRAIGQSLAQQNAQTGNLNSPSQSQTVGNAMNYGNAVYQRQEQAKSDLSNAISQATSFLPSSRTGLDSWGISTGTNPSGNAMTPQGLFGQATGTGTSQAGQATGMSGANTGVGLNSGVSLQNAQTASNSAAHTSNNQLIGSVVGSVLGIL